MSRALLILNSEPMRARAINWITTAKPGTQVEFREPKRTTDQNALLWASLTEIARQRPHHNGVKMNPDLWKAVFMQALGTEMVFLPTLNGDDVFPMGHRSSELSKAEFAGLLDLIHAWCAEQGISLHDPDDHTGQLRDEPNNSPRQEEAA